MRRWFWVLLVVVVAAVLVFAVLPFVGQHSPNTVRVGALLPLSGDAAAYGNYTRDGMLVGLDKVNADLAPTGHRLEIVFEDSRANPRDGVSAAQKLLDVDRVVAIMDDSVSGVTLAVAPICNRAEVVLLSTGATSPSLSGISPYFFRIWNSDLEEGRFSATFVRNELKPSRVAVLYINNEYGEGLRHVFSSALQSSNATLIASEPFPQGATDFRAQLVKVKAGNPEVIYLIAYPKEAKMVLKQAREAGVSAAWVGTVVMLEDEMPSLAKQLGYALYFPSPASPDPHDPALREFRERFRARYHREPPVLADVGYDAIVLVGSAVADGARDGPSIRRALAGAPARGLASGLIRFDNNGDVHKPMMMKKIG